MTAARVYIVEEHASVRLALADRLSHATQLRVIGHTGKAEDVIRDVREHHPDVVLVEVKRSDGMGLEILRQLSTLACRPNLIVLTSYPSSWEREAACRAGASSYLLKDIEPEELIRKISLVAEH